MANKTIDLSPAVLDLVLYAGDGADFEVDFVDEDQQPIDVSHLTWAAQIRKTRTAEISHDLEIVDTNAATGVIVIHISAEVTRALPRSNQWDLQSTAEGSDEPLTVLQGSVICNQDVTREEVPTP